LPSRSSRKEALSDEANDPRPTPPVAGAMTKWDAISSALGSNARAARLIAIILASAIPPVMLALLIHRL
jgi:hypothetical protein